MKCDFIRLIMAEGRCKALEEVNPFFLLLFLFVNSISFHVGGVNYHDAWCMDVNIELTDEFRNFSFVDGIETYRTSEISRRVYPLPYALNFWSICSTSNESAIRNGNTSKKVENFYYFESEINYLKNTFVYTLAEQKLKWTNKQKNCEQLKYGEAEIEEENLFWKHDCSVVILI